MVRQLGPMVYELDLPAAWKIHKVFHTRLLGPFRTSKWSTTTQERGDAEIEPEDDKPYEVQKLLQWRWVGPSGRKHKEFWCSGRAGALMTLPRFRQRISPMLRNL